MLAALWVVSLIAYWLTHLPAEGSGGAPALRPAAVGERDDGRTPAAMARIPGPGDPADRGYFRWLRGVLRGELGVSLGHGREVGAIIRERLPVTLAVVSAAFLVSWLVVIPLGVLAGRSGRAIPRIITALAYVGGCVPSFLAACAALAIIYVLPGHRHLLWKLGPDAVFVWSDHGVAGLLGCVLLPALIVGVVGGADVMLALRVRLRRERNESYVTTARTTGLSEMGIFARYPFRAACCPLMRSTQWLLPRLIGWELVVSAVLGIPTLAPVMIDALVGRDLPLAAGVLLVVSAAAAACACALSILAFFFSPGACAAVECAEGDML